MAIPKYGAGKLSKVKPEQVKNAFKAEPVEKMPEPMPVKPTVIRQEKPAAQSMLNPQQTPVKQAPPVVKPVTSCEKSDGEPA